MLISTIAKYCAGAMVAGTAIAVPVLATTQKWGSSSNQSVQENQVDTRSPVTPTKETVPVSQEQIAKENQFDDCLNKHLQEFQVRNTSTNETKTVSVGELPNYLSQQSQWTVLDTYKGQCKMKEE